jgi:hypothetical protein
MSEEHDPATPEREATVTDPGGTGHLLAAMEALAAALECIGTNVPAAQSSARHFRAAQEHLKHARTIFG